MTVVIVLVFLWFWATEKELSLLLDWLDPVAYLIPVSVGQVFAILGFGVLLVLLVFASRDPLWFGLAFTSYSIALVFATKYMNSQIATAILRSRQRVAADLELPDLKERATIIVSALDALESYFLTRPAIKRLILICVFSSLALCIGVWWAISGRESAALLAYSSFIVIIVVSELVIAGWRIKRDIEIKRITEQFRELERDTPAKKGT